MDRDDLFYILSVNGRVFHLLLKYELPTPLDIINTLCTLIQQTCVFRFETEGKMNMSQNQVGVHKEISQCIMSWLKEFNNKSRIPSRLKKLCVFTIRQNMRQRHDEDFCQLRLPPGLLPSVTLSGLAEELYQMYPDGCGDNFSYLNLPS